MKYAIVTGVTSGIGEATALKLAQAGYGIIGTGRRAERLEQVGKKIDTISRFIGLNFDVREEEQVKQAFDSLNDAIWAEVSILINNAGLAVGRMTIEEGLSDDWNRMLDTNVKGLLYVSRYVIPKLKQNGGGHIVNIASIAGKEVYLNGNVYCASKHAVDALSKAMRMELVQDKIKVTNIAPGAVETEFSIVRFKGDEATASSVYDNYEPLVAQDIANTIAFVVTQPKHVCINDLVIMPTAQATSTLFAKDE